MEFGFHLHVKKDQYYDKIKAAYDAGVRLFDTVIGGLGGCPAALTSGELVSNLRTIDFIKFCNDNNIDLDINIDKFYKAREFIKKIINI